MEMRGRMVRTVHPDHDAVELAEARHGVACYRTSVFLRWQAELNVLWSISALAERAGQLGAAHAGAPRQVAALGHLVELGPRLRRRGAGALAPGHRGRLLAQGGAGALGQVG